MTAFINHHQQLENFIALNVKLDNEIAMALSQLPALFHLHVSCSPNLSSESLSLPGFSKVTHVHLGNLPASAEEGFQQFVEHHRLNTLDCRFAQMESDKLVKAIASNPMQQCLNLDSTKINGAGVESILDKCHALTLLLISNCPQIGHRSIDKLREKYPHVKIQL